MKKFAIIILIILILCGCIFAGCTDSGNTQKQGVSFKDALGRSVTIQENPERVISLQGSFAETWLLAGGKLVGVTTDAYEDLNLDIDASVVGTVKEPNTEKILELNPQFVIMSQDIAGHREVAKLLDSLKIDYAYFKQETFEDYLAMLEVFCKITQNEDNYITYGTSLKARIDKVISDANSKTDKPKVLFVRARSQGVSAKASDHMVCTMLDEFGCVNIANQTPSLLENISIEQIIKEDPDVILVTCMGDENNAKEYLKKAWESNPAWSEVSAVKNNRYIFLQKNLFHFKPNSRWAQAYETLYKILFQ